MTIQPTPATGPGDDEAAPQQTPIVKIVRGDPTPEELAALVAVLAARGGEPALATPLPHSVWNDRRRAMRTIIPHGRGAWRASGLPH